MERVVLGRDVHAVSDDFDEEGAFSSFPPGQSMKLATAARLLSDHYLRRGGRNTYYAAQRAFSRLRHLSSVRNRPFARQLLRGLHNYLFDSVTPVEGQIVERAKAAVQWILRAQSATPDAGVSLGYFPCDKPNGWKDSYPETTGYIVPSLLEYAERTGDESIRRSALEMALWEVEIQLENGAVQGGPVCPAGERTPAVFNTGTVVQGWIAAYRVSGNPIFLEAARRAAEFLLADIGPDGHFRTHGRFVSPSRIKTYNVLCAWPLYRLAEDTGTTRYRDAALRITESALLNQLPNGWFSNNCLTDSEAPLLHTIGYTLQGILEVGHLADRTDFIAAVQRGTDPVIKNLSPKGFLHGRYYSNWESGALYSCLTGSAQLAIVCYRLYQITNHDPYKSAADLILNYLKGLQVLDSADTGINGALAGSFPLWGSYMTMGYPNWATKYLLDALMLQDKANRTTEPGSGRAAQVGAGNRPNSSDFERVSSLHSSNVGSRETLGGGNE